MYRIHWNTEALEDLAQIMAHIAQFRADATQRLKEYLKCPFPRWPILPTFSVQAVYPENGKGVAMGSRRLRSCTAGANSLNCS